MANYNINAVTRRVVYTGSAGVGPYAFSFEILVQTDVDVYFNATLLTLTTDYTVTINANGTGSVTLVTGTNVPTTPDADDQIAIVGARDIERTTDFVTAGELRAAALNEQLDGLTIFDQQLLELTDRALTAPITDPISINMTLPTRDDRKGKYLAFNATTGDPEPGAGNDDITALSAITDDIARLADIEDGTLATDAIQTTASNSSNITTVAGNISNVNTVAGNNTNISSVASNATNINTVAGDTTEINAVAGNATNINTVASNATNINSVAGNATNINTVAGDTTEINAVASNASNINTVAGSITNVNNVGGSITNVNTVATNIADVNNFADVYRIGSTDPTTSLDTGDLFFNTTSSSLKVYDGAAWVAGVTAGSGFLPTTGGSLTGNVTFTDNTKAFFGTGSDLEVFHDGSNSIINDAGTGELQIQVGGSTKLSTSSTGVDVTGTADMDTLSIGGTAITATAAELNYVDGVTSAIQTQLDAKAPTASPTFTGDLTVDTDTLYVDSTNDRVGIGTTSPSHLVEVTGASNNTIKISSTSGYSQLLLDGTDSVNYITNIGNSNTAATAFYVGGAERARIDSSGSLLVGKTTTDVATQGARIDSTGRGFFTRSGSFCAQLNRLSSDGEIFRLSKDGSTVGSIASGGGRLAIGDGDMGLRFVNASTERISPYNVSTLADKDNAIDLGESSARFDDVYATNGTIQTSDLNLKTAISSLTDAEITAAKAISKLFKTFKWSDKVEAKGDAARTHSGVIAQEVQQAMTDAGLNAGNYAFFISTTWWEADETYTDDDGVEQTRTNTYDTAEESPEGATERTRLGIRYPELLSFIGAATEQRLASIEARLDALEATE